MKFKMTISLALLLTASSALSQDQQAVSALGRIEPENGILKISASSTPQAVQGGILVELHVEKGDDVRKGDLLAVTDTAAVMEAFVYEAQTNLLHAEREVEAARGTAVETCLRADVAAREAERRVRLHEQGVAGEEEADSAMGEADARKASCANASINVRLSESGIEVARARLSRAQAEAQRSYIRAPVDGRVIDVLVWPGELIGKRVSWNWHRSVVCSPSLKFMKPTYAMSDRGNVRPSAAPLWMRNCPAWFTAYDRKLKSRTKSERIPRRERTHVSLRWKFCWMIRGRPVALPTSRFMS